MDTAASIVAEHNAAVIARRAEFDRQQAIELAEEKRRDDALQAKKRAQRLKDDAENAALFAASKPLTAKQLEEAARNNK